MENENEACHFEAVGRTTQEIYIVNLNLHDSVISPCRKFFHNFLNFPLFVCLFAFIAVEGERLHSAIQSGCSDLSVHSPRFPFLISFASQPFVLFRILVYIKFNTARYN